MKPFYKIAYDYSDRLDYWLKTTFKVNAKQRALEIIQNNDKRISNNNCINEALGVQRKRHTTHRKRRNKKAKTNNRPLG